MGAAAAGGQGDAARVMHRNGKRVCAVPAGIATHGHGRRGHFRRKSDLAALEMIAVGPNGWSWDISKNHHYF